MQQWFKCPKCGKDVLYGANPCPYCNCALAWSQQGPIQYIPPPQAPQQPVQTPQYQQPQQSAQTPQYQQQAGYSQGEPKKKTSAWLIGCLSVIGFVILVGGIIYFSNIGSKGTPSPNPPSTQQYSIGQDVIVGKGRWTVLSARDRGSVLRGSDSKYPTITADKTTTGKFIEVNFELENMGTITETWVSSPTLIDNNKREFKGADGVSDWIPNEKQFFLTSINPGVPAQFVEIYEVSKDSSGLKLKVSDISFGGSAEALISLGF